MGPFAQQFVGSRTERVPRQETNSSISVSSSFDSGEGLVRARVSKPRMRHRTLQINTYVPY